MDLAAFEDLKDRFGLSKMSAPALAGIVAVIAVVAALAAGNLMGAAASAEFEVSKEAHAAEGQSDGSGEGVASTVFVHVSGAVSKPGLYELQGGSRVADAIEAAGGFADDAATASVNLARTVSDGEQIIVSSESGQVHTASGDGSTVSDALPAGSAGLVNINSADVAELVSLPGIGESTASKIVADRQANGPFKTIDDLKRVSGIGDKKFEAISGLICI